MLNIGLEIKILRERLKISSKELAQRIGLSQSQMSRLEKGQRRIDTTILRRIAEVLGVEPGFFFRGPAATASPAGAAAPPPLAPSLRYGHIGKLVRSERRKKHLSVDELATRVGKTRAYLAALEDGRHALDADLADRIAKALRLSPQFVVEAQAETIEVLEGQMVRLEQALAEAHRGAAPPQGSSSPPGRTTGMPFFGTLGPDFELVLGQGEFPVGEPEDFLYLPGLDGSRCFALGLGDDSMETAGSPTFRRGDIVAFGAGVSRSRDFILAGIAGGPFVFRQVFYDPDGSVRLQPLNLAHPALVKKRSEIAGTWKLVLHVASY
jgi:transcriptional regulator with XRE-family HTH domain